MLSGLAAAATALQNFISAVNQTNVAGLEGVTRQARGKMVEIKEWRAKVALFAADGEDAEFQFPPLEHKVAMKIREVGVWISRHSKELGIKQPQEMSVSQTQRRLAYSVDD